VDVLLNGIDRRDRGWLSDDLRLSVTGDIGMSQRVVHLRM
jgi:hypothetical protein